MSGDCRTIRLSWRLSVTLLRPSWCRQQLHLLSTALRSVGYRRSVTRAGDVMLINGDSARSPPWRCRGAEIRSACRRAAHSTPKSSGGMVLLQ